MADPLSILSVAASITQFLDLGYRLIKGVKEIHDSAQGALEEVAELKLVAEDIKNLNQDFTSNLSSSRPLSKDDIAIRALAGKCNALADELLRELRPLTLPPDTSHRMLQSARVSIRHLLAWKDIVKIRERLSIVETQLRERVARATQKDQRSSIRLILDNLRRENEDTLSQSSSTTLELECEGFNTLVSAADRPPKKRDYDITLNALHSSLVALLDEGRALGHRQSVIQSLSFKAMKKRQDQIDTAHFKTLDWAFDRSKTTFVQWLEERQGLYWVNGQVRPDTPKLGSYKSRDSICVQLTFNPGGQWEIHTYEIFVRPPKYERCTTPLGRRTQTFHRKLLLLERRSGHAKVSAWSLTEHIASDFSF
jgi:hypothetical protein